MLLCNMCNTVKLYYTIIILLRYSHYVISFISNIKVNFNIAECTNYILFSYLYFTRL